MALSALVAPMARSTNRSTAAGPDPLILLLCVTSLAAPVPMSGACGPARNITNRGSRRAHTVRTAGLTARRASIVA